MPLVERYNDWATDDESHDDPHILAFDHRVGAGDGVGGSKATCLITILDSAHGWIDEGNGKWIFDPDAPTVQQNPTLGAHLERNLGPCIQRDQIGIMNALTRNQDAAFNVTDVEMKRVLENMQWPADGSDIRERTSFVSRFPLEDQYFASSDHCSGYHLGNGIVATAGHCLQRMISRLHIVFGWSGNVRRKRFKSSQVFRIEKLLLCHSSRKYADVNNKDGVGSWARQWDHAVIKLKGHPEQFQALEKVELAKLPPQFGRAVYNIGCPLGTPLKISPKGHVLRHAIFNGDESPFSHTIGPQGTYSTDLDQFPGSSGGPVFDAHTGQVVGHASVAQNATSESTLDNIGAWERKYLVHTQNYRTVTEIINPHLAQIKPDDPEFRIHSKYYRTLSGKPSGGGLFESTTFICPGDIGPSGAEQPSDTEQAVFNRHKWDSLHVIFSNLTARIDKVYIFTSPLRKIFDEFTACELTVKLFGNKETFARPDRRSNFFVGMGEKRWLIASGNRHASSHYRRFETEYGFTIDLAAETDQSNPAPLDASLSLGDWTYVKLEQPFYNFPRSLVLEVKVKRDAFPFAVDKTWPPERPDVTNNPADDQLMWPAEEFCFRTTVGFSNTRTQYDELPKPVKSSMENGFHAWEAPIDRIWT